LAPNPKASVDCLILTWYILCLLCNRGTSFGLPPISLERILLVLSGEDKKKRVERLFFCIGNIKLTQVWSCLACYMMSFPYSILFNKKEMWEIAGTFFPFLGMSNIACVFTWYLKSLCINLLCLDMIESLWLYLPSVFLYMQKLDRFFPHAMKMYTIQDSPKGTSFLLWLFASRNSG
jgi:hypothetical protein